MDKNAVWKWLILILLTAGSLALVVPPSKKIRLGLDLKGGTSFVVAIDQQRMRQQIQEENPALTPEEIELEFTRRMDGAQARALEVIRNRVDNLGISEPVIYAGKDDRITIQLPGIDEEKRRKAEATLKSLAFLEFRIVHEKNDELLLKIYDSGKSPEGYRWTMIGPERLLVRDRQAVPDDDMNEAFRQRLARFGTPSAAFDFMLEKVDRQGQTAYRPHFVQRRRQLTGENLEDASVDFRSMGQPVVQLKFDSKGAKKFAAVTSDYAPGGARNPNLNEFRQLAIVLDNTLYSAPTIREPIFGGRAEISGSFTVEEANYLANVLRAGSLPAPVEIVEKRFVAPSLGADSIRSGTRAIIYGGVGIIIFMLVYYMVSGLIADIALVLDMVLLPLGMVCAAGFLGIFAKDAGGGGAGIQLPVLTLPGIAGILLTIGMAVDANVLIFERIREECGAGKRLWSAILAGYDRAFVTILDANLTTLLTGVILFVFGSGPIRGFAVTLCAGILVSMFTALVATKLFFGLLPNRDSERTLRMLSIVKRTSIDFVGGRKFAITISILVIAISWAMMVTKGMRDPSAVFGVDFTGGSSVTFSYDPQNRVPGEAVRSALEGAGLREVHIQYQDEMEQGGDVFLQVKVGEQTLDGESPVERVKSTLPASFPAAKFTVEQEDAVGAQVGSELQKRAVWAIVWALVGIILYISWRFELGFAVGAIVALVHDVLVTVGIYSLFGRQLSLPIVAALLTIVGYSVNDTIVVFDRIREDLRLTRQQNFRDICNLSINQTLSRTLLTSLTTLITVAMLLVFGGGAINDFALALCIGVVVGTYSSIFVATPVVLAWHRDRKPDLGKS